MTSKKNSGIFKNPENLASANKYHVSKFLFSVCVKNCRRAFLKMTLQHFLDLAFSGSSKLRETPENICSQTKALGE